MRTLSPAKAVDVNDAPTVNAATVNSVSLLDDPNYKAAADKLGELNAHVRQLSSRSNDLRNKLEGQPFGGPPAAELRQIGKLLGDGDDGANAEDANELRAQLQETEALLRVAEQAVAIQKQRHDAAKREASHKICAALVSEHRELARGIVEALKNLRAAILAERRFRDALDRANVEFMHPLLCAVVPLGDGDSPASRIDYWLSEFDGGTQYKIE